MKALKTVRFWVLLLFVALLVGIGIGTIVVAVLLPKGPGLTTDEQIAEEGVVWAAASFVVAVVAAALAVFAYAVASQRPSLRILTTIKDNYREGERMVDREKEVNGSKGASLWFEDFEWVTNGAKLWIRVFNDASYSAHAPAVTVEVVGFKLDPKIVVADQDKWKEAQPRSSPEAAAWMWDGGDSAIHGPKWFRSLPYLDLKGVTPPDGTATASIRIEAVAEGARTVQVIKFARDP